MKNAKTAKKENARVKKTGGSKIWVRILLALIVLIVYGRSVNYEFTLDDDIFYLKHSSVQKGLSGTAEIFTHGSMEKFDGTTGVQPYRPVTLLSFAFEKQAFDNDPAHSHFINILLYIIILQVIFSLLLRLFPATHMYISAAVVLLFALHPVHTEVIASVKSRDELLAALFGLLALMYFIRSAGNLKNKYTVYGTVCFALALLSKESAISFLAVIPLALYMFSNLNLKRALIISAPLLVTVGLFLWVRFIMVGTESAHRGIAVLDNVLAAAHGFGEVTATKAVILYHYLQLLFIPWPLSWDYSYNQIPVSDPGHFHPWLSLLIHAGLLVFAILFFRKKPVLSFSILFYFICSAPTNNFFINNGSTVGERFLFVPSLGFVLALVYFLAGVLKVDLLSFTGKRKTAFITAILGISLVYLVLSISRISDWQSNFTLFKSGAEASPNSSRANQALGTAYQNMAMEQQDIRLRNSYSDSALQYLEKSITILPSNADAAFKLGQIAEMNRDTAKAIMRYRTAFEAKPGYYVVSNNLGAIYAAKANYDSALFYFDRAYRADSTQEMILVNLMVVHLNRKEYADVLRYATRAEALNISNPKITELAGQAKATK